MARFQVVVEFRPLGVRSDYEIKDLGGLIWHNGTDLADMIIRDLVSGGTAEVAGRLDRRVSPNREYRLAFGTAKYGIRVVVYINAP